MLFVNDINAVDSVVVMMTRNNTESDSTGNLLEIGRDGVVSSVEIEQPSTVSSVHTWYEYGITCNSIPNKYVMMMMSMTTCHA